ncbi:hypothetical protein ACFQZ8_18855 [Micromonospora azadirachtae]|uniref:NPCBM-associated, NEW3 domain of alpha-galactosidase n=1 Tax=Micromonospora azadirachtae TaxID=1970735 RepID=A0ABW3A5J5_9ACTN
MAITVVLFGLAGPGLPTRAGAAEPDEGSIGIRLLEAPTNRRDDPRALRYIVDHLRPGTTIKRQLLIVNRSAERRAVELYPAAASVDGTKFVFAGGRAANELTSWITIDRDAVELEPWEETRVRATIAVPADAPTGERYGVLWASAASSPSHSDGQVTQVHRVGVRVYLDVGEGGEPVSDFTIGEIRPARSSQGEPSVTVRVDNTGGRAVDLTGTVMLTDGPAGSRVGPFPVSEGTTLAAGATGQVSARFPAELPNGPWKIEVSLKSGRVERSATGRIQFPDPGGEGVRATLYSRMLTGWGAVAAVAGLLILAGLAVLARRFRRTPARVPRERISANR